jgi:hypothetical protein
MPCSYENEEPLALLSREHLGPFVLNGQGFHTNELGPLDHRAYLSQGFCSSTRIMDRASEDGKGKRQRVMFW